MMASGQMENLTQLFRRFFPLTYLIPVYIFGYAQFIFVFKIPAVFFPSYSTLPQLLFLCVLFVIAENFYTEMKRNWRYKPIYANYSILDIAFAITLLITILIALNTMYHFASITAIANPILIFVCGYLVLYFTSTLLPYSIYQLLRYTNALFIYIKMNLLKTKRLFISRISERFIASKIFSVILLHIVEFLASYLSKLIKFIEKLVLNDTIFFPEKSNLEFTKDNKGNWVTLDNATLPLGFYRFWRRSLQALLPTIFILFTLNTSRLDAYASLFKPYTVYYNDSVYIYSFIGSDLDGKYFIDIENMEYECNFFAWIYCDYESFELIYLGNHAIDKIEIMRQDYLKTLQAISSDE